ncbi:MAG: S41 family peptidase [Rickettsiales bacterium]|jgi:carboxyl-terminal processing protease|nr:S41 family peptidase [Rickettsiales bacterium]
MSKNRILITLSLVLFAAAAGTYFVSTSVGTRAKEAAGASAPKDDDVYRQLELFGRALEVTKSEYVDEVSNRQLIEAAIQGMVSKLDPHSDFLNAEDSSALDEQTTGEFGGLGIEVTMDRGVVKVISPMDDTPADKAGILPGDLITHIDGVQIQGLTLSEAIKKMKGKPGTSVALKVFREGKEPFDLSIVRDVIRTNPVKFRMKDGNVGYIRLSTFNRHSYEELESAIKNLGRQNPEIIGYILDLRNNTGGLLHQAYQIADAFIGQGEIVSVIGRHEKSNKVYFATEGDLIKDKPMVVIINGASASASEIVAGALKDHRRAVVVGTKSYGKGSVQTVIQLGSDSALKITTARYYTPSGRSIQAEGIEPDIVVNRAKVEEIKEERMFAEDTLAGALKNDTKPTDKKGAREKRDAEIEERDKDDYQLGRAIDIVKGLAIYEKKNSSVPKVKKDEPKGAKGVKKPAK